MNILLITQNFYPEIGSGANRFKNLYKQLNKHHDVTVLTTHPSYPNAKMYKEGKYWNDNEINDATDIIRLKMRSEKQGKSMFSRILYYLELAYKVRYFIHHYQSKYDVIYVTSPNIFIPWASFFFQKHLKKTVRILEVRDLWPESVKEIERIKIDKIYPLLEFLEKRMYKACDKIIINNEGFRSHIEQFAPDKEILYLPNAFTIDEVHDVRYSNEFKVIYTGNIGFAQNYEVLKNVAVRLNSLKIPLTVIPYGVRASDFKNYVENQQLKYVTVYNEMNRAQCLEMIRSHNVMLSILKENEVFLNVLPGKVIDGIGSGIPVVTNLGGYAKALIDQYEVGYAKEKATGEEIVQVITQIKDHPKLEEKYRNNSIKLRDQCFIWENNIQELLMFLRF